MSHRRLALGGAVVLVAAVCVHLLRSEAAPHESERPRRTPTAGPSPAPDTPVSGAAAPRPRGASAPARTVTLRAWVVDGDGQPLGDGFVTVVCPEPAEGAARETTVSLGPEGEVSAPACPVTACLELNHAGLVRAAAWEVPPQRVVTLVARPLARLEGRVLDPEGKRVVGARVTVVRAEDDAAPLPAFVSTNTTTDEDGAFAFARVERPPCDACTEAAGRCSGVEEDEGRMWGRVTVVAQSPGFVAGSVTLELHEGGDDTEVRLVAPGRPISGRVLPAGEGGEQLRVVARASDRPWELLEATVGTDGRFEITEVGAGSYELRVLRGRQEVARARAGAGSRIELQAAPGATPDAAAPAAPSG